MLRTVALQIDARVGGEISILVWLSIIYLYILLYGREGIDAQHVHTELPVFVCVCVRGCVCVCVSECVRMYFCKSIHTCTCVSFLMHINMNACMMRACTCAHAHSHSGRCCCIKSHLQAIKHLIMLHSDGGERRKFRSECHSFLAFRRSGCLRPHPGLDRTNLLQPRNRQARFTKQPLIPVSAPNIARCRPRSSRLCRAAGLQNWS